MYDFALILDIFNTNYYVNRLILSMGTSKLSSEFIQLAQDFM